MGKLVENYSPFCKTQWDLWQKTGFEFHTDNDIHLTQNQVMAYSYFMIKMQNE